jgi:hypothetical protein
VRGADRPTSNRQPPRAKARWYHKFVRGSAIAGCVGLALLASGCDPNDTTYFRQGIGTELYTADTASATDLQNIYLDYLCRQSNSYIGPDVPSCSQQVVPANYWPVIVQAGMNDIDTRCDSYLAWLDQKKRENAGILTEIGAVRFAVDSLTNPAVVTSVSPVALAAISAAFGLATSTVNNFNSLLLQVDHTTVQNVVFSNRQIFRESLLKFSSAIDNKPAAIHTLRTYLSICMPMTISASINSTVTVFQQTGSGAGAGPTIPTIGAPLRAAQAISKPDRSEVTPHPEFAKILDRYDAKVHSAPYVTSIQKALCVPKSELGTIGPDTKTLIKIYQATKSATDSSAKTNGKLDAKEIDEVLGSGQCATDQTTGLPTGPQNFFEKRTFNNNPRGQQALAAFIDAIKKVPGGTQQVTGTSLDGARNRIQEVRGLLSSGAQLMKLPVDLAGQVTPDLFLAVSQK